MSKNNRPLSPHLQIYRPQITSILSIMHRITGAGLAAGVIMAAWWLLSVAQGADSYATFYNFAHSFLGRLLLLGWLWAMTYHLLNGIRHLAWDMCYGFELKTAAKSGWTVVGGSILLTLLFWFMKG